MDEAEADKHHELDVATDLEHERRLMYRVLIVVELVMLLMIIRQAVLH